MANSNGWGDGSVNNSIGWGQGSNNATGWGKSHLNSWSGATDIDGGNLPSNSVAPAISGTAQEGQTVTCSTGTWSGSPTYTYQWYRGASAIGSATSSSYTLVTADVSQNIKCVVTATNFVGSNTANSNTITPIASGDADALAFISAAGITDNTQKTAINTLVTDLKGYGIWTKMKAIYPFVGGTASTHKYNLKDPRDLDAAFRLVFNGGWTHSSTGATPNGTNGYADTKLSPSSILTQNSTHLSFYSRTNISSNQLEMASIVSPPNRLNLEISWAGNLSSDQYNYNTGRVSGTNSNSTGFYIATRISASSHKVFKNNSQFGSTNTGTANSLSLITPALLIGGYAGIGYSSKQCAFSSIGDGLTDTEAANLYTAVQAFQTTLSRNV